MNQIGKKIIRLESVDSTNNYTANVINEGKAEHGTVILAVEQFAGRGQRNAEWLANAGENLTFSIFWDEVNLSVDRQFDITRLFSVALVKLLSEFGISASIKWPNDIFAEDKKIAGILIENQLQGNRIKNSVIGIGLNVNQNRFDSVNAISMALVNGKKFILDDVLFALCGVINRLTEGGSNIPSMKSQYLENLYLLNEEGDYLLGSGEQVSGVIRGVQECGKLLLELNGQLKEFDLKELSFIPRNA